MCCYYIKIDDFERKYYSQLNGIVLHVVASYKYLGHYITYDLPGDRQRRTLFVQGNIMQGKFNMCTFTYVYFPSWLALSLK